MKTRRRKPDRLPPLPDRDAVRLEAAARLEEIAAHVWPDDVNVRRSGRSIRYGTKGARVIHVEGPMAGRYADWEAGHHGDVFDLWARAALGMTGAGADFPRVLRDLADFLGVCAETGARHPGRKTVPPKASGHGARETARLAANTVANQDAQMGGDLCLRCHSPAGWLAGRSVPTDGLGLMPGTADFEGVVPTGATISAGGLFDTWELADGVLYAGNALDGTVGETPVLGTFTVPVTVPADVGLAELRFRARVRVPDPAQVGDRLVVRVPQGADVVVGTHSGRVEVSGPVGRIAVTSHSGKVEITDAGSVDVRADSGKVEIVSMNHGFAVDSKTLPNGQFRANLPHVKRRQSPRVGQAGRHLDFNLHFRLLQPG